MHNVHNNAPDKNEAASKDIRKQLVQNMIRLNGEDDDSSEDSACAQAVVEDDTIVLTGTERDDDSLAIGEDNDQVESAPQALPQRQRTNNSNEQTPPPRKLHD